MIKHLLSAQAMIPEFWDQSGSTQNQVRRQFSSAIRICSQHQKLLRIVRPSSPHPSAQYLHPMPLSGNPDSLSLSVEKSIHHTKVLRTECLPLGWEKGISTFKRGGGTTELQRLFDFSLPPTVWRKLPISFYFGVPLQLSPPVLMFWTLFLSPCGKEHSLIDSALSSFWEKASIPLRGLLGTCNANPRKQEQGDKQ